MIIAIIRIKGKVEINKEIEETFKRLNLPRKYSCTLINGERKELMGMIKKIRNFSAYGEIDKETLIELVKKRAKIVDKNKKVNLERIAEEIWNKKQIKELEIRPFFALHPPRGGIDTKSHFPKGVLGDHKEKINELIKRMI
ncbi:MAG: uL30 family ribosomal protein [Candidatus Pacearchaeota archaeon]